MERREEYTLYGHIEYQPVKTGFVTPVFSKEQNFYVEISIKNTIKAFVIVADYYKNLIKPETREIDCRLKPGDGCWYAFKWKELLYYGSSEMLFDFFKDRVLREEPDKKILRSVNSFIRKPALPTSQKTVQSVAQPNDSPFKGSKVTSGKGRNRKLIQSIQFASEEILIEKLKLPEIRRKAEEELFYRYNYFIKEGTRRYQISEEDAFDAYADTLLVVIHSITSGSYNYPSSLKTFLYAIFNNKIMDLMRQRSSMKHSVHENVLLPDSLVQVEYAEKLVIEKMIDRADLESLKDIVSGLGEVCKHLLLLFEDGYSDKEIAEILKYKSANVAKTTRLRCLEKIRNQMKNRS